MARPKGIEPPTYGLEIRCSILLSYGRVGILGAGNGVRTRDSQLGGLALYQLSYSRKVGARGFEPPAPCSQSRCASKLRYAPKQKLLYKKYIYKSIIKLVFSIEYCVLREEKSFFNYRYIAINLKRKAKNHNLKLKTFPLNTKF